jgi:hypothetical protein
MPISEPDVCELFLATIIHRWRSGILLGYYVYIKFRKYILIINVARPVLLEFAKLADLSIYPPSSIHVARLCVMEVNMAPRHFEILELTLDNSKHDDVRVSSGDAIGKPYVSMHADLPRYLGKGRILSLQAQKTLIPGKFIFPK